MTAHCDPMCPFLGCASCEYSSGENPPAATESTPVSGVASGCPWSGENPTTATVSDARTGVACETIEAAPGVASTNTKGLTTQTGLES